jgi:hypothetical protein
MASMRWSEETSQSAPTIKNHSVTHFNNYLFCVGGYDGRRNHNALLLYSIAEQKWIRPHHVNALNDVFDYNHTAVRNANYSNDPSIILVQGTPPPGRNGHSATLAIDPDDPDHARLIIIGGWLGTGPLAASDTHILEIREGGRLLQWYQPPVLGTPPGPCNMHSADYIPNRRAVYVFRGGNGREYLNDLHAFHVENLTWARVETTGAIPQQRANHSSAMLEETGELFIFGGWNGGERLNDIHVLDTETSNWTCPRVGGVLPHPRAGMTLTALRGRLFLFGGSGTSAKCFQDLQILDRQETAWLDVTQYSDIESGRSRGGGGGHSTHNNNNNGDGIHYETDESIFRFGGPNMYDDVPGEARHDAAGDLQQGGYEGEGGHMAGQGNQEDGTLREHGGASFASSHADWHSRDLAALRRPASSLNASPNPNDQDTVPSVVIHGHGPGRRYVTI